MGKYVVCPYYVNEKELTITCEDTMRVYGSVAIKESHSRCYCCDNWRDCCHAIEMEQLYERIEEMSDGQKQIEKLRHYNHKQKYEIRKIRKDLDESKRGEKAAVHLARSMEKRAKQKEERAFVLEQKVRSLEMFIGYLAKLHGLSEVSLDDVREYGLEFDAVCTVKDDKPGVFFVESVKKKQD
jgi:hypothetical protein